MNVDFNEVNKFSSLASSWWNPNGELRTLHQINPLRLSWINSLVDLENKSILDVGCGGGLLSESLAKSCTSVKVLGIDLALDSLEVAINHGKNFKNLSYRRISIEDLAKENLESFDIITCMEMLEHVPNPDEIINSCSKLLKKNGYLFLSTINKNLKAKFLTIWMAEYILRMLPIGTHNSKKFIKPNELAKFCRQADLNISASSGINYSPLKKKFKLSQNCDVNYMLLAKNN